MHEIERVTCPCQSGENPKDCCFSKKNHLIEQHWSVIKARVTQNFFAEHPTLEEIANIQHWIGEGRFSRFKNKMNEETVQHLLSDAYFFTENCQQWGFHLMRSRKEIIQAKSYAMFSSWQKPLYFIGEIIGEYEEYMIARHLWSEEIIYLADLDIEDLALGEIILGHVVPGVNEHFYSLLSSAIMLKSSQRNILERWFERFEQSQLGDFELFYKEQLIDCLLLLVEETTILMHEEKQMDVEAIQLIISLDMLMLDLDVKNDTLTFLLFNYLTDDSALSKIRKKEALIAAIVDFGMRYDFIPKVITQRKLAANFNIATSTVSKYSRQIELYFNQDFDKLMLEKIRQPVYTIGTDAKKEEYERWKKEKQLQKMVFTDELERKRMEKTMEPEPLKTTNKKDRAQKYAYEAYLASSSEKRYELAQLALLQDANNLDAKIIMSELHELRKRVSIVHEMTEQNKSERLDHLYISILYQLGNFTAALEYMKSLSKERKKKVQILRYYEALLYLKADDATKLERLLARSNEKSSLDKWLKWLFSSMKEPAIAENCLIEAIQANPFVQKYIELNYEPTAYPTHQQCSKGDPNEAKMIHFILYPFIK